MSPRSSAGPSRGNFAVSPWRCTGAARDTKIELGRAADGTLLLADEVLTPDSSRFWPAGQWVPGRRQYAFDKQVVRDWAAGTGWDKRPPGPHIPAQIVQAARARYAEIYERITGTPWVRGAPRER